MKRRIIIPATLGLALIGGILFATSTSAQSPSASTQTIIQRIAQRFNLNESEVQKVFEEHKDERKANMKVRLEQKLTQAVSDKKITEAQKQAILDKFLSLKDEELNKRDFKNLTEEERKAKVEERRTDLETWANKNGLTIETLKDLIGNPNVFGKMHMRPKSN